MFVAAGAIEITSSVRSGTQARVARSISLLRSSELLDFGRYKHFAPTELTGSLEYQEGVC